MRGYADRLEREHLGRAWLASRTGWLAQVDPRKQPSVAELAGRAGARRMSADEMQQAMHAHAVRAGG